MERALARLVDMQYQRTQLDLFHGAFRVRGDVLEILPAYEDVGIRVEFFGDEIERISRFDPLRGEVLEEVDRVSLFPKTHYVTPRDRLERAIEGDPARAAPSGWPSCPTRASSWRRQRLEQRTRFDLEMLREIGYCHGIENYSRHLTGRAPGEPPPTLLDYFPDDFLLVVDESHQTIPQVRGMYHGDRSRKQTLVDYGFRLPSALDNRPLTFEEFDARDRPADLRLGHPGRVRAGARRRRGGRAGHPPHRPARPGDRDPPRPRPGRRPGGGDPQGGGARASGCWSPP